MIVEQYKYRGFIVKMTYENSKWRITVYDSLKKRRGVCEFNHFAISGIECSLDGTKRAHDYIDKTVSNDLTLVYKEIDNFYNETS